MIAIARPRKHRPPTDHAVARPPRALPALGRTISPQSVLSWSILGPPLAALLAAALLLLATALLPAFAQRAFAQPAATAPAATAPAASQRTFDPEGATGRTAKTLARAGRQMVAAANPYAADAGVEILRAGGSAVDAAIAVQMVLNLVEPQSSGIGGGAFLLHWDQRAGRVRSYDGRETAPAGITSELFLKPDGTPRRFGEALLGGHSVGVPGAVRMLAMAHSRHGVLPWRRLFEPAIGLAEDGFIVSPRLSRLLAFRRADRFSAAARTYFFDAAGTPRQPGERLRNPELAATLRAIAEHGADAFYAGVIADAIVQAVRSSPVNPGTLDLGDIARYQARERPAICVTYHLHRVCGMGPPSSGGLVTAMTLKLIEPFAMGRKPLETAAVHAIVEAEKLAYADRDHWVADPDAVKVPAGLLDLGYLKQRRLLIKLDRARPTALPGNPPGSPRRQPGSDATHENAGTSHISIVDRRGNAVALTTSIEAGFGSGLMTGGFLLNNELTDFSFVPRDPSGNPIANAVAPNKRPRSSMSPTMVFDAKGHLVAVLGSPGGSLIPLYVVKSIVGLIDWRLDAQAVADLINFGSRNGPLEIETGDAAAGPQARMKAQLTEMGHVVETGSMTSGMHIIVRRPNGMLEGGADPRREGVARGD